ncbi:LamG-like jellyroll fold domain-containing protein [Rubritalea tangerina]|uniref:LamG-like jellyroll fold domain-containing protein n=1 Tax=Rubritalea tangerina TaxID=430798 RepID=A0ABW4ZE52_9BACT
MYEDTFRGRYGLSGFDYEEAIYSLLDGSLDREGLLQLEKCLLEDADARAKYHEIVRVHTLLEVEAEQEPSLGESKVVSIEELQKRQKLRWMKRSVVAAAAVLLVGVSVLSFFYINQLGGGGNHVRFSKYSLVEVNGKDGVKGVMEGGVLEIGDELVMEQGCLELELGKGVRGIIEGPARLSLVGEDKVMMQQGVGWFDVSSGAEGFTVLTPHVEVVDLGTCFAVTTGMSVAARDEVHVFEGRVKVRSLQGTKQEKELHEGEAIEALFGGDLKAIPSKAGLFLTELPESLISRHWSFDDMASLGPQSKHPSVAKVGTQLSSGNRLRQVDGVIGKALDFAPGNGYVQTDWAGIESDRPRSVACWIKSPEHMPRGSIVEWGIPQSNAAKWRVTLNPAGERDGGVRGALRTEFGWGYVIGSTDLRDGKWHHVVSVYDGSGVGNGTSIRLYVDGKREAVSSVRENRVRTILDDSRSKPCQIGSGFHGLIDEVIIYDGVLPEEEILRLSRH